MSGSAHDLLSPLIGSLGVDLLVVAASCVAAGGLVLAVRKGWRLLDGIFEGAVGGGGVFIDGVDYSDASDDELGDAVDRAFEAHWQED
jgi:hypothetical protein